MQVQSDLLCMSCGNIFPISRQRQSLRETGHIKDIYCILCKKITKHLEYRNVSLKALREKMENNLLLTVHENTVIKTLIENNALEIIFPETIEEEMKKIRKNKKF